MRRNRPCSNPRDWKVPYSLGRVTSSRTYCPSVAGRVVAVAHVPDELPEGERPAGFPLQGSFHAESYHYRVEVLKLRMRLGMSANHRAADDDRRFVHQPGQVLAQGEAAPLA
jgi:hypothetical protein